VFIPALSLALGVLSFAAPVSSLGTGVAVAVCFSPEEDCTALAVDAIDRAEIQILVSAYGLTTSSKAVEALIRPNDGVSMYGSSQTEPRRANARAVLVLWPRREYRSG
jgi:hypothetical protein